MKTTLKNGPARQAVLDAIGDGTFAEASWVTGKHHADPGYEVGDYVTASGRSGDWTDHPRYSGARHGQLFDDGAGLQAKVTAILAALPDDGDITIITTA